MNESLKSPRILVVDDEVKMCFTLQKLLELVKYQVEVAHDGLQALEKVNSFQPQCVLLDIRMPNKNGVEVLKEIKSSHPETAVIMTTAVAAQESKQECLDAGAHAYLIKPIDFKFLQEQIKEALEAAH